MPHSLTRRAKFRAFAIALGAALAVQTGSLPAAMPAAKQPLEIAEQGNFYVGGREVQISGDTIIADAMYVQYQIPAHLRHPYPLVLIHGGASSGSYFWSTPDGREGWATLFLRMGFAVYVVDRPTMGRSPYYEAADGALYAPPTGMPQITSGMVVPPSVKPETRFPGKRVPGDQAFEQGRKQRQSSIEVPFGMTANPVAVSTFVDEIDRAAGAALLDRIGPAILVTHSRAGASGWQIADERPQLVKAVVAVEPNGPPFYNAPPLGQPGDPIARPFGITYGPLEFAPPVKKAADFGELQQLPAKDNLSVGCWMPKGPAHTLTNLAHVPVLVVTGGSSYHAAYDHCTAEFLAHAGVPVRHVNLDGAGIPGNTHSMMGETNNAQIAKLIADWLSGLDD